MRVAVTGRLAWCYFAMVEIAYRALYHTLVPPIMAGFHVVQWWPVLPLYEPAARAACA